MAMTTDDKQFILNILLKEHDCIFEIISDAFDRNILYTVADQFNDELILRQVIEATAKKHSLRLDSLYTWKYKMDKIQWYSAQRR